MESVRQRGDFDWRVVSRSWLRAYSLISSSERVWRGIDAGFDARRGDSGFLFCYFLSFSILERCSISICRLWGFVMHIGISEVGWKLAGVSLCDPEWRARVWEIGLLWFGISRRKMHSWSGIRIYRYCSIIGFPYGWEIWGISEREKGITSGELSLTFCWYLFCRWGIWWGIT